MDYSPEALEKRYNALPDDVRNSLSSEETAETLNNIGGKHGLLEAELDMLVNETGFVMLGLTHPSEFIQNLTTKLGISRENAGRLAEDINMAIFRPIRESLKKIHSIGATPNERGEGPAIILAQSTTDESETPTQEDVLREIEDAPKSVEMASGMAAHAEKLQNPTESPHEVVEIHTEEKGSEKKQSYGTEDPYREPI